MKPVVKISLVAAALLLASAALAEYHADKDVYVRVDEPIVQEVAKKAKLGRAGNTLFETQEAAHETVTETTGEEIDHYYINICSGDECVPVDPMRLSN